MRERQRNGVGGCGHARAQVRVKVIGGRPANVAVTVCPLRTGVGSESEPVSTHVPTGKVDAACAQIRKCLRHDRDRVAPVGAGVDLDRRAVVDARVDLHRVERQRLPVVDRGTEHGRAARAIVGDAIECGCRTVAGAGRIAAARKLERRMKRQRSGDLVAAHRRRTLRQIVRQPERELALDLHAPEQACGNFRPAVEQAVREHATGQGPVMPFEHLHGAHRRTDLPARDRAADQFGHAVLDRVGVCPRRGRCRGQRNGAAAAPCFGEIARKLFELCVISSTFPAR